MSQSFDPNTIPHFPDQTDMGIGIIGCGMVVRHGHMPAYRNAGFRVIGIASRTQAKVEDFAREWKIDRAFDDWRRLIEMPEVQIICLTYPFDEDRLAILRFAAAHGKHVLIEKPLAHSRNVAAEMVQIAHDGGIQLAVNQNARWCPQYWAARQAIEQGLLGEIYFVSHDMQNNQDSSDWFHQGYYPKEERFQLVEYTVHHIDLLRYWTGVEPTRVRATIGRKPGQRTRGEMLAAVQAQLPNGGLASLTDDNVSHPDAPSLSRFRIEGTRGMIDGTTLSQNSFHIRSDFLSGGVRAYDLPGNWFPNSFAGTMGELMRAVRTNTESSISARDNLRTLAIVFSAYDDIRATPRLISSLADTA